MTTLSISISGSANDADESSAGNVVINGTTLGASLDNTAEYVGLRFIGVSIPIGSTILSSTVGVIPTASTEDEPDITIYASGDVDTNQPAFSAGTATFGISAYATGSTTNWSSSNLGANGTTRYETNDIGSLIATEITGGTWPGDSTGSLIIVFQGSTSTTRDLTIKSYDSSASDAAILTIDFVPPPNAKDEHDGVRLNVATTSFL